MNLDEMEEFIKANGVDIENLKKNQDEFGKRLDAVEKDHGVLERRVADQHLQVFTKDGHSRLDELEVHVHYHAPIDNKGFRETATGPPIRNGMDNPGAVIREPTDEKNSPPNAPLNGSRVRLPAGATGPADVTVKGDGKGERACPKCKSVTIECYDIQTLDHGNWKCNSCGHKWDDIDDPVPAAIHPNFRWWNSKEEKLETMEEAGERLRQAPPAGRRRRDPDFEHEYNPGAVSIKKKEPAGNEPVDSAGGKSDTFVYGNVKSAEVITVSTREWNILHDRNETLDVENKELRKKILDYTNDHDDDMAIIKGLRARIKELEEKLDGK